MTFEVCLFDIDGTLISSAGAGRRALERACHIHVGRPDGLDGIRLDGKTDPAILDEVFFACRGRRATPDEARAVFDAYAIELAVELRTVSVQVLPGVHQVLDWLSGAKIAVGVATGNLEVGARLKLERAALWQRFAFGGFGSDAAARADLVEAGIRRAKAHLGRTVARSAVVVVGDTPLDVAAAHAAGARAVGVATGSYGVDALMECGADEAYPTLEDWLPR